MRSEGTGVVIAGVLQHNHGEFTVGRNHNLMLIGPDSNEGDVFFGVESLDGGLGLGVELSDEGAVLNGLSLGHGGLNSDTLLVDDHNAEDTHMGINPVKSLFYLL
jgi:hypothetical protein